MKSVMERNETFAEGKAEGVSEGKAEEKFETIRRLRMNGIDERVIHLATDMPIEEIRRLY